MLEVDFSQLHAAAGATWQAIGRLATTTNTESWVLAGEKQTMTSSCRTKTGRTLNEGEVDALAEVAETTEYDIEVLAKRRRGRPLMGPGLVDVVPVRIDPELRAAVQARAELKETSTSAVIPEAIRAYLEVAWTNTLEGSRGLFAKIAPASVAPVISGRTPYGALSSHVQDSGTVVVSSIHSVDLSWNVGL